MKTVHVLFIQGAGYGAYEEDRFMASHLQRLLGEGYSVIYPPMPNENKAVYNEWKSLIAAEIDALEGTVILAGHSLGASVLLKYVSEERLAKPIAGMFLLAPPYWGTEDWEVTEYQLFEDFAIRMEGYRPLYFYHSRDDDVVPFAHFALYAEKLPWAVMRQLEGYGHLFNYPMVEVAEDIKQLDMTREQP